MKKHSLSLTGITTLMLFFFILLTTGCKKKFDTPGSGNPNSGVNDNEMVTGGVTGNVVDENNRPVMGATITSGTNTTTTDRYGSFRFSNISLSKANGKVKVVVPGYFNAYRTFVSVAGRINNVRIKLIPKTNSGNFSATAGGTVNITGGAKIVMPANAITNAAGAAYSGAVNVAMAWIDPSSPDLPNVLMGDLRGITTTGEERGLSTFGMIGIELTDMGGQSLKIASGKTAELTFPIPSSLLGAAPATIDLWHFDEATARWKQEGTASKTGNNFVANVSHFSFWNCDVPFPLIDLCMSLVNSNNIPLINVQVRIKRLVNNTYECGRTDSMGNLCGKVPKDEALLLEVLDLCNSVLYSQNIGPFSSKTSLPTITVNIPPTSNLVITGTITNCSGANVTNGAVHIYVAGANYYSVPVTNGTFTINILRCNGNTLLFTLLGIDYSSLQETSPIGAGGITGTVNMGTIQICGTALAVEYIEYLIGDIPLNISKPPGNISATHQPGSPPYSTKTQITGSTSSPSGNGTLNMTSFLISNNMAPANGLPLNNFGIYTHDIGTYGIATVNPTANITAFGPPLTGFIEGNFTFQMNMAGTLKTATCNFRVRRN